MGNLGEPYFIVRLYTESISNRDLISNSDFQENLGKPFFIEN
jgi:hypothetical protein